MRQAFAFAAVRGYGDLSPVMPNHPKDRHVLAAAVRGSAAVIVTVDLRDPPSTALSRYDIEAVHPDQFLSDQLDLDPQTTLRCFGRATRGLPKTDAHNEAVLSLAGRKGSRIR